MAVIVKTVSTLAEAAQAVASERGARFMSGGTLIMRALNDGDVSIETVVRHTDIAYRRVTVSGARVELGGGARMVDILKSRDLAFLHPVARTVGGPAVRAMATVGGNLYAPAPYGDFAAALLALDAQVMVQAGHGAARAVPIEQFLQARDRSGQGLVAGVTFNRPDGDAFRFIKATRIKPKGISVLSISAVLPQTGGRVTNARVAYAAMAPLPVRAKAVERALEGRALDDAGIAPALAAALDGTAPVTDAIASDWYRREVAPVHLKRLLLRRT